MLFIKSILLFACVLLAYSSKAQAFSHKSFLLGYNSWSLRSLTSWYDVGDLRVASDSSLILLPGYYEACLLDSRNGSFIKRFDDSAIFEYMIEFVRNSKIDSLTLFDEQSIKQAPTCQQHPIIYRAIYHHPNDDNLFYLDVGVFLKNINSNEILAYVDLLVLVNSNLETCTVHHVEYDKDLIFGGSFGGGIISDSQYVALRMENLGHKPIFINYILRNGRYVKKGFFDPLLEAPLPLAIINHFEVTNTFFTNGDKVFTKEANESEYTSVYSAKNHNKQIHSLQKLKNGNFVGVVSQQTIIQYPDEVSVYLISSDFKNWRRIDIFNGKDEPFRFASTSANNSYILTFDPIEKRFKVHVYHIHE